MAITKIRYIGENSKTPGKHLRTSIQYITHPAKTEGGRYIGARSCQADTVYEDMMETKQIFGKEGKRQAYHIIISFNEGEITPDKALSFMDRFAKDYLRDEYECIYAVHTDTDHVHGHLIFNSVNKITGKKYRYEKGDWEAQIQPLTNRLCEEYGLATLIYDRDDPETKRTYSRWGEKQGQKNVWSDMIRRDVDAAILLETDFEAFLKNLEDRGYEIKQNKYISVRPPGMERFRRLATLGADYTTDRIRERITTESLHTRRTAAPTILRVRVPYHLKRTKLTGLQRRYFRRLYETGKLKKKPYSQAWKYREEIKRFHKLQEDYLFLAKYEIQSYEKLLRIKEELSEKYREAGRTEKKNYRSRRRYRELFAAAERMDQLAYAKEAFEMGDAEFHDEYEEYLQNEEVLRSAGYDREEIRELQVHFDSLYRESRRERSEIRKQLRTANRILSEAQESSKHRTMNKTEDKSWKKTIR